MLGTATSDAEALLDAMQEEATAGAVCTGNRFGNARESNAWDVELATALGAAAATSIRDDFGAWLRGGRAVARARRGVRGRARRRPRHDRTRRARARNRRGIRRAGRGVSGKRRVHVDGGRSRQRGVRRDHRVQSGCASRARGARAGAGRRARRDDARGGARAQRRTLRDGRRNAHCPRAGRRSVVHPVRRCVHARALRARGRSPRATERSRRRATRPSSSSPRRVTPKWANKRSSKPSTGPGSAISTQRTVPRSCRATFRPREITSFPEQASDQPAIVARASLTCMASA